MQDVDALDSAGLLRLGQRRTNFCLPALNGDVAVFPGKPPSGKPVVLIASPYLPFPLSHGAAVRIYNLMRRGAQDFDQVLVAFVEDPRPVPQELRDICVE